MKDNTYNGWTNFETWQANLWLNESDFIGMLQADGWKRVDSEDIESFIWNILLGREDGGLLGDIANAWISSVNFVELADNFNLDLEG